MNTEFHPLDPDSLIQLTIEELTVFLDEVVCTEHLRTFDFLREVQVVLNVAADAHGEEVHVGHHVPGPYAFLTNRRRRGLRLQRGAHGANTVLPTIGFAQARWYRCRDRRR